MVVHSNYRCVQSRDKYCESQGSILTFSHMWVYLGPWLESAGRCIPRPQSQNAGKQSRPGNKTTPLAMMLSFCICISEKKPLTSIINQSANIKSRVPQSIGYWNHFCVEGGALAQPPFRWGGRGRKWEAAKDQFLAEIEAVACFPGLPDKICTLHSFLLDR